MSLRVTVLGCAGSYPEPDNACSGYLVRSPEATIVVDLGSGTLANLQRHVSLAELDAVVLTHQHPDHWLDVPILRTALRYYLGIDGLAVYSPQGLLDQAAAVIDGFEPTLVWTPVDASTRLRIGDAELSFSTTDHPVDTLAVRIEAAGRTLVYTADTGSAWEPGDFIRGADLLMCEATMSEKEEGVFQHLSGRQAGALARENGVGRLLVTHIPPNVDRAAQLAAAAAALGEGQIAQLARVNETFAV